MTCMEFQGLMIRYINGELSYKEREQFIEHAEACEECREELEIYYIILTSMRQMDADEQISDDYHQEYLDHLAETKNELIARKKASKRRRIAFPAVVGATVLFTGLSTSEGESGHPAGPSSAFEMKFRFNMDERHRMYEPEVDEEILVKLWNDNSENRGDGR